LPPTTPNPYLTHDEFKQAIRNYLSAGPPDEVRPLVERLEMEMASPGDWEAAKTQPDTNPE